MKKETLINLRVNKDLKEKFQNVVCKDGCSMSEVLEALMVDVAKRGYIPLNIRSKLRPRLSSNPSIPEIKKQVSRIVGETCKDKIRSAALFGSYARGEEKASSDIDILIDAAEGLSLLDLTGLGLALENALHKKIDLAVSGADPYFDAVVSKDKIIVYEAQ